MKTKIVVWSSADMSASALVLAGDRSESHGMDANVCAVNTPVVWVRS